MKKDIHISEFKKKFEISFSLFLIILSSGTLGFWLITGMKNSLFDCLYMTVITVTTVGYGEVVDLSGNPAGRAFAMLLIFSGMSSILYFVSNITAFLIEGNLNEIFWRNKMQKSISGMKGHYIVCGAGTLGEHIIQEFSHTKRPTVVIDISHEKVEHLKEKFPGTGIVHGDSTDNETLSDAGVERAAGLIAATGNDKDNLVITITARQINPELRIVTRANEMKNVEKLRRAGADSVVSSNFIGALRMASEMVRPAVVSFLDTMLRDTEKAYRVEEVTIPEGSPMEGKTALDVKSRVLLLAVQKKEGVYEFNPPDSMRLSGGDVIIFMGRPEEKAMLEGLVGHPKKD